MPAADPDCALEDCDYAADGSCREGNDPASCPNRRGRPLIIDDEGDAQGTPDRAGAGAQMTDATSDFGEEDEDDEPSGQSVALGDGARLGAEQCRQIMAEAPTRVIAFIAPKAAGKTSLIAGLYEAFLEGRVSDALFRSSRTIPGFERLCHLSRQASGGVSADMERTALAQGLGYYHLDIVHEGARIGLLLGDRPGENFINAAASLDQMRQLEELAQVSTMVFLIDGRLLVDPLKKGVPNGVALDVLDALTGSGLMRNAPKLALVLTKADVIATSGDATALDRFQAMAAQLGQRYAAYFSATIALVTSASPDAAGDPARRGDGVPALLDALLRDERAVYRTARSVRAPARMFGRLHPSDTAA